MCHIGQCVRLSPNSADLALLGDLLAKKEIKAVIDSTFKGLDSAKAAFERAEKGRPVGKVVIEIV